MEDSKEFKQRETQEEKGIYVRIYGHVILSFVLLLG